MAKEAGLSSLQGLASDIASYYNIPERVPTIPKDVGKDGAPDWPAQHQSPTSNPPELASGGNGSVLVVDHSQSQPSGGRQAAAAPVLPQPGAPGGKGHPTPPPPAPARRVETTRPLGGGGAPMGTGFGVGGLQAHMAGLESRNLLADDQMSLAQRAAIESDVG